MAKRGRKGKYETHVKPYLSEIMEWCRSMTEAQIAEKLGVGNSTFQFYKGEYQELSDALKKGRRDLVADLRSALIKKALGYDYEEKKQYIKTDLITGHKIQYTEITTKPAHPDVAAINLALKNYDKDNWANDPAMLDLKKQELELRKQAIENKEW